MRNPLKNTEPLKRKGGKVWKNIKVGKNQIFKDGDGTWVVEKFEYMDNGIPMYSVYDAYKSKSRAMRVARMLKQ